MPTSALSATFCPLWLSTRLWEMEKEQWMGGVGTQLQLQSCCLSLASLFPAPRLGQRVSMTFPSFLICLSDKGV